MTRTEFWKILSYGKGQFELVYHRDFHDLGCIRYKKTGTCPICYVDNKKRKRKIGSNLNFYISISNLGLEDDFGGDVADASDGVNNKYRAKLLKVLEL